METLSGELREEVVAARKGYKSLLVREPILGREAISEVDRDLFEFAEECEDFLGYSGFYANLKEKRRDEIAAVRVRNALYELGIVPYKTESVKKIPESCYREVPWSRHISFAS